VRRRYDEVMQRLRSPIICTAAFLGVTILSAHCGGSSATPDNAEAPAATATAPTDPAATCSDSKRNATETDVDCGGPCAPCAAGKACGSAKDCANGTCTGGICAAASCNNAAKDPGESDVDCGGACAPCATGKTCAVGADCASAVCTGGTCAAPSCTDGTKNGNEVDADCGGSCQRCAEGKSCASAPDCASGACVSGKCVPATCTDKVKNGSETDINCGGGACPKCVGDRVCLVADDCTSGICNAGYCQATCTDGLQNQKETDVDCGGSSGCPKCLDGKGCGDGADCASQVCSAGKCQAPSCQDNAKNGVETDVDCGGSSGCPKCALGKVCKSGADCMVGVCNTGVCGLPAGCSSTVNTITTCAQLQAIPSGATATYMLGGNIDCAASSGWNGGAGFLPLQNFRGCLLGQGRSVTGLFIRSSGNNVGMIADGTLARISDLAVTNADVQGTASVVGIIAGSLDGSTVSRVFTSGKSVSATGFATGGVIGYGRPSSGTMTIEDSYSSATVTGGNDYTGGLVGVVDAGGTTMVRRCYATGNVTMNNGQRHGGLITYSWGTVQDSFATGSAAQGLCYGVFGSITNSFFSGGPSNGTCGTYQNGGTAYFKGAVSAKAPFNTWDFTNTWKENANDYPTLRVFTP